MKKTVPNDMLRMAQVLDGLLYQIGKGDLDVALAGKMISLWREASNPFFKELFESVLCLEAAIVYPDKAPFLIGKHSMDLSYGLAEAIEAEAQKVVFASFRRGFAQAERDADRYSSFKVPEYRAFPYVGFIKAAMGSFYGMRVVPTVNYIMREFGRFRSGEDLDALCVVLQDQYVDPALHWRKEASIHTARAYHYGYMMGAHSLGVSSLMLSSNEDCCPVCREMTGMDILTEFAISQYRKIAKSSYEDLPRVAPFPTTESIAEWVGNLAYAPFSLPLYHPFCNCHFNMPL